MSTVIDRFYYSIALAEICNSVIIYSITSLNSKFWITEILKPLGCYYQFQQSLCLQWDIKQTVYKMSHSNISPSEDEYQI